MTSGPDVCPCCGAGVPNRALACPECGADEQTGWSDDSYLDGLDLPDDDGEDFSERPASPPLWMMVAGILIVVAFVMSLIS